MIVSMKKKILIAACTLSTELSSCQTNRKFETPVHEHRKLAFNPDGDQTQNLPKPLSPKEYGMNLKHKRRK